MRYLFFVLIVVLALQITGCGGLGTGPQDQGEFAVYVDKFIEYAKEQGFDYSNAKDLSVSFGDIAFDPEESAECDRPTLGSRRVLVNKSAWVQFSDIEKEVVMLHELGHCILNREHREDLMPGNTWDISSCPESIMYHSALKAAGCFGQYKEQYLKELFN